MPFFLLLGGNYMTFCVFYTQNNAINWLQKKEISEFLYPLLEIMFVFCVLLMNNFKSAICLVKQYQCFSFLQRGLMIYFILEASIANVNVKFKISIANINMKFKSLYC